MKVTPLKPGRADHSQPLRASRIAIWPSITQNESISEMCATNPLTKVGQTRHSYWENATSLNKLQPFRAGMALTLAKPILCRIYHSPKRAKAWPRLLWEASSRAQTKLQFFNSRRMLFPQFPNNSSTQQVEPMLIFPPRSKQDPMLARPKQSSKNSHFLTSNIYASKSKAKSCKLLAQSAGKLDQPWRQWSDISKVWH